MSAQYHVKLAPGDVAPYVLLPGDPGRVPVVASYWDEAREVARNREYVTYTGIYRGRLFICTSTGEFGAPSTAIALEELARVGATTFVRIGTCRIAPGTGPHRRRRDLRFGRLATTALPGCTRLSSSPRWRTTRWSPRRSRRPTVRT